MSPTSARSALGLTAALASWLTTAPARADDAPKESAKPGAAPETAADGGRTGAQALFEEALALARNGDFPAACVKLEQSQKLYDGIGSAFHLAGCWQKTGRTASAYDLFVKISERAREAGQPEREEAARARAQKLLPQLSRLRIDVASPAPGVEVRRDKELIERDDWGKGLPVDRGMHEIRVTAEGRAPWSSKVDVSEPAVVVAVQVPKLAELPREAPAAKPAQPVGSKPEPGEPPADESSGSTRRTIAVVVGGIGVAALAGGVLEGAQYLHFNREAEGLCPSSVNCTTEEIDRHSNAVDEARTARTWAYVGVGAGALAVGVGAYLFLTAPRSRPSSHAGELHVEPIADGRGTWGGALSGRF